MKKTLIAVLAASALLSACRDDSTELAKQAQTINELNSQITQLQDELSALKAKTEAIIPAIEPQPLVIFSEKTSFAYPKNEFNLEQGSIDYQINALQTSLPWLDALLLQQFSDNGQVLDAKALATQYQQAFAADKAAMLETPISETDLQLDLNFLGQQGKLAQFSLSRYEYSGGAHGMHSQRFLNVDMAKKQLLNFNDVFKADAQGALKSALWEVYTQFGAVRDEDTFTSKGDFQVSDNIYFAYDGVHFVYDVYAIASYAEGEQELVLSWKQLAPWLTDSFKQAGYLF